MKHTITYSRLKVLIATLFLALAVNLSYGLTIEQITAAKSSIVSIIEENTKTGDRWEGTGWFIDGNRIVTNDTVVNYEEEHYDRTTIVNVGTGESYTFNRILYQDAASDVALILINEFNSTHLNLSKVEPVKGMEVTVIGNPKHVRGAVTTGKITDVKDNWINTIYLDDGLKEGNSGSPVFDNNGDVLGMVRGAEGDGSGVAVTAKTLQGQIAGAPWVPVLRAELAAPKAERVVRRAKPKPLANVPDLNNWTTETLKQIFIPPTRITRVHGKIKTVTFLYPPDARGSAVNAYQCFNLIFMFLFGPNLNHDHDLEPAIIDGKITEKDLETGYLVTRDRETSDKDIPHDHDMEWRYHFTVTKNNITVLTAALIEFESEKLGPQFVLHIK